MLYCIQKAIGFNPKLLTRNPKVTDPKTKNYCPLHKS